ncbi:MAG: efflux RND transporter permease subunit [Myxococcales bacterium]
MTLSDVAIRRPVFTAMMSVTLIVLGFLGYRRLGTDLYPDVTIPAITVTVVYPGASPQDSEESVTRHVEDAVAGISGVDRVISWSRENVSVTLVRFKLSVPIAEAVQNVRDKIGVAQAKLPRGSEAPIIAQFDISAQPVIVFSAVAEGASGVALRAKLDEEVRPRLEQIEGVAAVRVVGGAEAEYSVELFPDRLLAAQLTPDAVFQKLKAEHLDLPGGHYASGPSEVGVRVQGEFKDVDQLRQMPVAVGPDGSILRLSDVALVRKGIKERTALVRTNGVEAVAVEVLKQAGSNSAAVANSVKALLPTLEKQYRFSAAVLIDQALVIEANAHEVWIAIFFGGAMAVLIILVFLLDWRGTFISSLALPTSVVGTLFGMWAMGFSVNQLTLLGLSLAIGLLIDDAVVVRESITRRLEKGESPAEAASHGTSGIALAVMATTFTLVAVFVPVAFMQGIVGQFFRQFGLTITVAVLISLFIAFSLDPMLSARLAKARKPGEEEHEGAVTRTLRRGFEATERAYGASLTLVLRHRFLTMAAALALLGGSVWLGKRLGTEFMPREDRSEAIVNIEYSPGTSLETTSQRSAVLEEQVRQLPGVTAVYSTVGYQDDSRRARWRVKLVDKATRADNVWAYQARIRSILSTDPKLTGSSVSDTPILEGIGDYAPIIMRVSGPDMGVLRKEGKALEELMKQVPALADVQFKDSPGKPELQVDVKREEAARAGIPAGMVALQVRLATQGEVAGKIREGKHEAEIRVRLSGEDRGSAEALERLWVMTPRGPMALSQVAGLKTAEGPAVIERQGRERSLPVVAEIKPGHDMGEAIKDLHAKLDARALPEGYSLTWDGVQEEQRDTFENMALALAVAVAFIFIVLASQFESLIHPFTIMLSLPLAVVGALGALYLTGKTISMGSLIGLILLMGLVTKNAILLVDGALQHLREGDTPDEAIGKAGPRRLRPILMTSAAMVLGMLPTALGRGMGSEFRSPMAIAVIGGVITSTMLTLWVVPVVFTWIERLRFGKGRASLDAAKEPEGKREAA